MSHYDVPCGGAAAAEHLVQAQRVRVSLLIFIEFTPFHTHARTHTQRVARFDAAALVEQLYGLPCADGLRGMSGSGVCRHRRALLRGRVLYQADGRRPPGEASTALATTAFECLHNTAFAQPPPLLLSQRRARCPTRLVQLWACCQQCKRDSLLSILRDLPFRLSKRQQADAAASGAAASGAAVRVPIAMRFA